MSPGWVARKRSSRWPAVSSPTSKASFPESSSPASKSSCMLDSPGIKSLRTQGRTHLPGDRGTCRGNRRTRRILHSAPPKERAGKNQTHAPQLHQRNRIVKHHRASGVASKELDDTSLGPVENQIGANDLPGKMLPLGDPNQNKKIQKFNCRFIKLRGMQMNSQRSSGQLCGRRIRKCHAPGDRGGFAVTTSRGKTSQPANRVPQRQPRYASV